ncbi:MAG: alpha/beta hydrolase [Anaerolineae bacterium]
MMNDHFVETNGIRLHYVDYNPSGGTTGDPLILLHGLTANAASFGGLIRAGLADSMRVIAVDLRGRGLSDKPETGYGVDDHAKDILGLMDALKIDRAVLGGHSYGGRVAIYLAVHHPERVKKLVFMDVGFFHPSIAALIMPSVNRLDKTVPSWDIFIESMRQSPVYHDCWDADLEAYFRADVETMPDGSVKPRSRLANIMETAQKGESLNWETLFKQVQQPAIILHAPDPYGTGDTPPLLSEEGARRAADLMANCQYQRMTGNHVTMVFGAHARGVVDTITAFVRA